MPTPSRARSKLPSRGPGQSTAPSASQVPLPGSIAPRSAVPSAPGSSITIGQQSTVPRSSATGPRPLQVSLPASAVPSSSIVGARSTVGTVISGTSRVFGARKPGGQGLSAIPEGFTPIAASLRVRESPASLAPSSSSGVPPPSTNPESRIENYHAAEHSHSQVSGPSKTSAVPLPSVNPGSQREYYPAGGYSQSQALGPGKIGGSVIRTPGGQTMVSTFTDPEDVMRAEQQLAYSSLGIEERVEQDGWADAKGKELAPCPMNFKWARHETHAGYRCLGGHHYIPDVLIAEGVPGLYTMGRPPKCLSSEMLPHPKEGIPDPFFGVVRPEYLCPVTGRWMYPCWC